MKKMKIKRRFLRISVFLFFFLIGTIFILNPNIIEATTVENEAEQLIELPTVHSNVYNTEIYSQVMETSLNNAKFVSLKGQKYFPNVNKDTEYQINYEVDLPELAQNMMKKYDEIVIAVDVSSYMNDSWKQVKNFFANYFENSLGSKEVKMGIVPFNNKVVEPDKSHGNNTDFTKMLDLSNTDKVNMIKDAFGKDYVKQTDDVIRSLHSALDQADTLLNSGESENQVIIIITSGGYDNVDLTKLETFSQKSYDIMTYDVADKQDQSAYSALEVHQILGGKTNKFFKINSDSLESLEKSQEIVKQLKGIIGSVTTNSNSLTENLKVDLKFNFGEYIEYVENSYRINDTSSRTYVENEKTVLPLYHGTLTEQDGLMKDIDFKVKIKDLTSSVTFTSAEIVYQYGDWPSVIEKIEAPIFGMLKPYIYATLPEDWDPPITTLGDEVEVSYELKAESFNYNPSNDDELKEIVLVVDSETNGQFYQKLLSEGIESFLKQEQIKLGLVVYGPDNKIVNKLGLNETKDKIISTIRALGNNNTKKGSNIKLALETAADILRGGESTNKNIFIINFGEVKQNDENELKELSSSLSKYNIFTMDNGGGTLDKANNTIFPLEILHKYLFGNTNNYISYGSNGNEITKSIKKLIDKLQNQIIDGYVILGTKLVFDLGDDLESGEGTNKIEISVGPIQYHLKELNGEKQYVAQDISDINKKLSFEIKSLTTGDLKFRENTPKELFNYISYYNLEEDLVQLPLETPTIKVLEETSKINQHGLYTNHSVINFIQELEGNDSFNVVRSMNYTFGMTMDIQSLNPSVSIKISTKDSDIQDIDLDQSNIYLYQLNENETIDWTSKIIIPNSCISTDTSNDHITYKINNNDDFNWESGKKYLLIYKINFKESDELSDSDSNFEILGTVDKTQKNIKLKIKDDVDLPDLL